LNNWTFDEKQHESPPLPSPMGPQSLRIWASLILLSVGFCMHRMGPSFNRRIFGFPLALLGIVIFASISRPSQLGVEERQFFETVVSNYLWALLAITGTSFVLTGSSNYREPNYLILLIGWLQVLASVFLAFTELMESSIIEISHSSFTVFGLIIGTSAFVSGSVFAERFAAMEEESKPLSIEERELISAILSDRLEGN